MRMKANSFMSGFIITTTGEGKLLECPIVETSGEVLKDKVETYDGFKKITHMAYKSK